MEHNPPKHTNNSNKRRLTADGPEDPSHEAQRLKQGPVIDLVRTSSESERVQIDDFNSHDEAPLRLLRVRGVPAWANEGLLGSTLGDFVTAHPVAIQWALVSNYMIDLRWLLSACPALVTVPKVVIVHGESGARALAIHHDISTAGMQGRALTHRPPLPPYGTHHSKAFLLRYSTGLRVIICTANFLYCDCNNKSQGLFVQDFPLKDNYSASEPSSFESDLLEYIGALKLPLPLAEEASSIIKAHDFSSARVHLIASVPSGNSAFTGNKMASFGHSKLRKCLQQEPGGFEPLFENSSTLAQFSSLGNISPAWLLSFQQSLMAGASRGPDINQNDINLLWPTVSEVQNSIEGWFAGNSIPGYPDKVRKDFLMARYCRWGGAVAGRQRAMPHMKSYARFHPATKSIAWMCFTSHNLSKAAWGEYQKNQTQFKILSYELGVLLVPSLELKYRRSRFCGFSCTRRGQPTVTPRAAEFRAVRFVQWQRGAPQKATVQQDGILVVPLPVPYDLPPMPYGKDDVPWDTRAGLPPEERWQGFDSIGTVFPGKGIHYGMLQHQDWQEAIDR